MFTLLFILFLTLLPFMGKNKKLPKEEWLGKVLLHAKPGHQRSAVITHNLQSIAIGDITTV